MKDLPTLQQLFENSVFKIPDYQRGYSWENQHRKDLLEDLESTVQRKRHYTGTVVLKEIGQIEGFGKTYTKYEVVDGQQRITTVLILLNTIINELNQVDTKESSKIASKIRDMYIKEEGPQNNIYKLELDNENNFYFKEAILEYKKGIPRKIKSHNKLFDAKNQFEEYLNNELGENDFGFMKSLIEKITQSLIFTLYKVEDDAEVGIIFEVMNDRGKPLSQLEKVKNHLIYKTDYISKDKKSKKDLINFINRSWKEILENLAIAGKSKNEDENQFLRLNFIINFYSNLHVYTENGKKISINSQLSDIHKLVKNHFKKLEKDESECYNEIERYVDSLKSMSYKFKDIAVPYDTFAFQDMPNKKDLKVVSSQFGRLNIQSNVLVLLISIYENFYESPEELLDLMRLCEVLTFRLYHIGGRMANTAQNRVYSLACEIYNYQKKYDDVIEDISEILQNYVPEIDIEGHLADPRKDYYGWKGLRYFLYEYERERCMDVTQKKPAFEWEDLKKLKREDSIEHILPQTIRGKNRINYWAGRFNPEEHERNFKRLGNLTLSIKHMPLHNKGFDKKKESYKDSTWQIERDLARFNNWSEKEIDEREKELIEFAKKRWKTGSQ